MTEHAPAPEPITIDEESAPDSYAVPMTFTTKDMVGVIVALVALLVIGYAGYIWLNPDLSYNKMFAGAGPAKEQPASAGATSSSAQASPQPNAAADPAPAAQVDAAGTGSPAPGVEAIDASCAQCGMDASRSLSHVVASWDSGASSHFDSWDCVFNYAKDQGLMLQSAEVSPYGADDSGAAMLDALQAWYLYDTTQKVQGSMPPYVAAYSGQAAAQAAQQAMGGEVLDFAGLKAKWK